MTRRRWFDRKFRFDHLGAEDFPFLLERLRGAPARAADKVEGIPREVLVRRDGDAWSLQEHLGHLLDLDPLHAGRLDDYAAGARELRAADPANRKTREACHNERPVADVLAAFRHERGRLVARLEAWEPERLEDVAVHPRLRQPMRVVDMAYFTAEHDDHHLAIVDELVRRR